MFDSFNQDLQGWEILRQDSFLIGLQCNRDACSTRRVHWSGQQFPSQHHVKRSRDDKHKHIALQAVTARQPLLVSPQCEHLLSAEWVSDVRTSTGLSSEDDIVPLAILCTSHSPHVDLVSVHYQRNRRKLPFLSCSWGVNYQASSSLVRSSLEAH